MLASVPSGVQSNSTRVPSWPRNSVAFLVQASVSPEAPSIVPAPGVVVVVASSAGAVVVASDEVSFHVLVP